MNHCVPDWGMEDDLTPFHDLLPTSDERRSTQAPDSELVELLWRDGHVVMQSQNSRKPSVSVCELKQADKSDPQLKPFVPLLNPSNLIQEDETASWFHYALEDSLEKEFCSEFLCEMPVTDTLDANKPNKQVIANCRPAGDGYAFAMPPPRSHIGATQLASSLGSAECVNFSHFSKPMKSGSGLVVGAGDCNSSIRTVGSSACGSNQVQSKADTPRNLTNGVRGVLGKGMKEGWSMISHREGVRANTFDTSVTSSGGSGCSFGRTTGQQSTSNQISKRKRRDGEESECHSEEAEYESIEGNQPSHRAPSVRKSRAAEVHNLSERKRRDRINEKMKALQELIPHCNKSDKASMLDEAIEYLKSLQLQLQLMWMGSGIGPMAFPGVQQHYMSRASSSMMSNPIQLSRAPLVNHSMPPLAPHASQMSMQNVHLPESYAPYFGFPHMQLPPQALNLYAYGSHMAHQNQTPPVAGSGSRLPTSTAPLENIQNGYSG